MLSSTVMTIGPADAQELVKNRDHQRPTSKRNVTRFANDMRAGRWRLSGASISIWEDTQGEWGPKGELYVLNGLHRLFAVIESNTTQQFLVVYEDDPSVFDTFDNGLTRTVGTMVSLAIGPENSQAISVMTNMVLHYERHSTEAWLSTLVTKTEIAEWVKLQDRARLNQCIRDYNTLRVQVGQLGHWYSALSWLVHKHSPNANRWLEFHEAVVHGNNLDKDDARLVLRNYLTRNQRSKNDRWLRQVEMALGLKAWNAFITDTPRQLLIFRRDELDKSGMPKVL